MPVNFYVVAIGAILSMVLGAIWYGPLFGRKWMQIIKVTPEDVARRKEMQKSAGPLYAVQFVLSVIQIGVLNYFVEIFAAVPIWCIVFSAWLGFIVPSMAAGAMWNNDSKEISWARFLIQTGYHAVLFAIYAIILYIFY